MDLRGEWQNGARPSGTTRSPTKPRGTAISWRLGDQLSNCDDVARVAETTDQTGTERRRTVFDLTEETYLVRTRTPVGRERYREVPKRDLDV